MIDALVYIAAAELLTVVYAAAAHDDDTLVIPFQRRLRVVQAGLLVLAVHHVILAALLSHLTTIFFVLWTEPRCQLHWLCSEYGFLLAASFASINTLRACTLYPDLMIQRWHALTRFLSVFAAQKVCAKNYLYLQYYITAIKYSQEIAYASAETICREKILLVFCFSSILIARFSV